MQSVSEDRLYVKAYLAYVRKNTETNRVIANSARKWAYHQKYPSKQEEEKQRLGLE